MRTRNDSSGEPSASTSSDAPSLPARACAGLVRAYQLVLRPVVPPACRFAPSCSEYARSAILLHGVVRGVGLALRRTARCNGWHPGGYDPVPGTEG